MLCKIVNATQVQRVVARVHACTPLTYAPHCGVKGPISDHCEAMLHVFLPFFLTKPKTKWISNLVEVSTDLCVQPVQPLSNS